MKNLFLTTALLALASPALADTACVKVDKGGYATFERGCDTDGATGNRVLAVKDEAPVDPVDPDPVDPVDPPADPEPPVDPEPEPPAEEPAEPPAETPSEGH